MIRHFSNPLDARVFHLHIRIKPFGHHMTDQRLALFLEQIDEVLFFGDEVVDADGFESAAVATFGS